MHRSTVWFAVLSSLVFLIGFVGCSHGRSPVTPGEGDRGAQNFSQSRQVFGIPGDNTVFRDLDLATLVDGFSGLTSGLPSVLQFAGQPHSFAVQVSLQHIAGQGQVPWLAWLMDNPSPGSQPTIVDRMIFGIPSGTGLQLKFPKVDAIYRPGVDPAHSDVIVAVSFMWRITGEAQYGLGVIFMHWSAEAFLDGQIGMYDDHYYVLYNPSYMGNPEDAYVWGQDLAFNPDDGDLYVVYTNNESPGSPHAWKLHYFRISQQYPDFIWVRNGPWLAFTGGWEMNAWLPSVDIGILDIHPGGPRWTVGVAFTAQDHPETPDESDFIVAGNSWPAGPAYDGDHTNTDYHMCVTAPAGLNCGLPELDIAIYYPGTSIPFYAMAYAQENPVTGHDVMVMDSINEAPWRVARDENDVTERILPSIATHLFSWERKASVSCYKWVSEEGRFKPAGYRMNLAVPDSYYENEQVVQFGYDGVWGPWAPLNVAFADVGLATDIVMQTQNTYFMGFANSVLEYPARVYVAWGSTQ